jgi:hypothetical protein
MPGQHARLSPSGSHRWLNCAGSIVLESAFPNESNEWSDSGTAMHTIASVCLSSPDTRHQYATHFISSVVEVNDDSEPLREVIFTPEYAETVNDYLDTIRALTVGCELHVEQRVEFSEYVGVPDQFGTMDAQWLVPLEDPTTHELCICDLKTGFRFVSIVGNTQLMLYALGCLARYDLTHDIRSIRLMIYQPQHGGMREHVITIEELLAFAQVAKAAAQKVEEATITFEDWKHEHARRDWPLTVNQAEWEKRYLNPDPNEDDCAFCRAMSTCPAKRAKFERIAGVGFDVIAEGDYVWDMQTETMEKLSTAMKAVGELEDLCKAIRAEVERRLLLGMPVADFGLELGREGARNWRDPAAAALYLHKTMRLPIEKVYDMKLISPTTAETLAGYKQGKKVAKPKTVPIISERQWKGMQANIVRSKPVPSVKPASLITIPYSPAALDDSSFDAIDEDPAADLI